MYTYLKGVNLLLEFSPDFGVKNPSWKNMIIQLQKK